MIQPAESLTWIGEQISHYKREIETTRKLLAQAEKDLIDCPPEKDGEDFKTLVRNLRDKLEADESAALKWLSKQQLFDKTVAPEKRDQSETITRDEGSKCFTMFAIYMRTATEAFLTKAIPEIREAKTNEDAYSASQASFCECLTSAMDAALANDHLPKWAKNAVEEAL